MPYAVLAHAGEDFEPLEHWMPYAVLAHAGEDFEPLEHLICGFVPFESCCGFVPF